MSLTHALIRMWHSLMLLYIHKQVQFCDVSYEKNPEESDSEVP